MPFVVTYSDAEGVNGPVNAFTARDDDLNDASKVFQARPNVLTKITGMYVEYTCTSTVGTRLLRIQAFDVNSELIYRDLQTTVPLTANVAATFNYMQNFIRGGDDVLGSFQNWPNDFFMFGDMSIQIIESAGIDLAADDMIWIVRGVEYSAHRGVF